MPFDIGSLTNLDGELLFRTRREGAAAVWAGVPKQVFNMEKWSCGSQACALGWLAHEGYDGWSWKGCRLPVPRGTDSPTREGTYAAAARYFGITFAQSRACFGGAYPTAKFHRRWFISRVTPADVAKSLLALPYRMEHVDA